MKRTKKPISLLTVAAAVAGVAMGASFAMASHPAIPLYTYEEIAAQYNAPAVTGMQVMAGTANKQGMPYSPKATCSGGSISTGNCHSDNTTAVNSAGHTLKGYTALADHAFHAALGFNEWMDNAPSGLFIGATGDNVPVGTQTGLAANKPWLQSHGHNGKW